MTGHWTMCSNCQNVLHSETWFTGPGHFMLIMTNFYFCLNFLFFVFTCFLQSIYESLLWWHWWWWWWHWWWRWCYHIWHWSQPHLIKHLIKNIILHNILHHVMYVVRPPGFNAVIVHLTESLHITMINIVSSNTEPESQLNLSSGSRLAFARLVTQTIPTGIKII